ncbi:hypothetical protein PP614_04775 [Mycobacteroides abscessus]|uniref:hypothetical protein n=1 Tax=Mycobacteroides abscessus TaxID=36809 RepID=UPI00078B1D94|nr:hypothetical protein [Mycobacteroides abscessus]QST89372.1 hypothetical protein PROPHIGD51-1_38 [Mycobacterium phage prophiGD51-1]AMU57213.1 hypothetical protein A3O02_20055 [Mycobacteroides abscessus]AMU76937.1 hypothetical protein A3O06_22020 [Mycobacteroides abscessus]ANO25883.1 hypothetical protein BAB79_22015 [Mycobacteroides abscessus]MBE5434388.1 hypothetical protein [Mycobacteroides abscessus]
MAKRKTTQHFLSLRQFAARVGAKDPTMSGYKLPEPDAVVGPINNDGTWPRGTVRGWLESTIDDWQASRPGQGARTDLT